MDLRSVIRKTVKQGAAAQTASFADLNRHREAMLGHSSSYLRTKPVGYDMEPKNDPDGIFITLRD